MAITVSSTVDAAPPSAHVVTRYFWVADGVNAYQTLRETVAAHDGVGGSPVVVASVIFAVVVPATGKGPPPGITIAPAHVSLAGATSGSILVSVAVFTVRSESALISRK